MIIKLLLLSLLVFLFNNTSIASCNLPKSISNYDYNYNQNNPYNSNKDWQTLTITNYLMLDVSYSPNFCHDKANNKFYAHQCINNNFGLIVHGLWPQLLSATNKKQHPRNCINTPAISPSLLRKYLCLIPGIELIQKEWEKHGSCYYEDATDYLVTTKQLFDRLILPNWHNNNPPPNSKDRIIKIIKYLNPNLADKKFIVKYKEKGLKSLKFCYDLNYKYMSCKELKNK